MRSWKTRLRVTDLFPKNMIKVYIFTILSIIIWKMGEGRGEEGKRSGGEGGGGKAEWRGGGRRGGGRGADGGSTYSSYCHNVFLSLQLCEEELKN